MVSVRETLPLTKSLSGTWMEILNVFLHGINSLSCLMDLMITAREVLFHSLRKYIMQLMHKHDSFELNETSLQDPSVSIISIWPSYSVSTTPSSPWSTGRREGWGSVCRGVPACPPTPAWSLWIPPALSDVITTSTPSWTGTASLAWPWRWWSAAVS